LFVGVGQQLHAARMIAATIFTRTQPRTRGICVSLIPGFNVGLICVNAELPWYTAHGVMEETVPKRSKTPLASAAAHLLARLRGLWSDYDELKRLNGRELERIAADFGMSTREFKKLVDFKEIVTHGPHAADLLYQRMTALGITRSDVERISQDWMRKLQENCKFCYEKGACEKHLANRSDDPSWQDYCPNAKRLEAVRRRKRHRK
jgi:hypothetical protein